MCREELEDHDRDGLVDETFLRDQRERNSEHKFGELGIGRRTFFRCNRKKREVLIGRNWLLKAEFSISVGDLMCWRLSNTENAEKKSVGNPGHCNRVGKQGRGE